MPIFMHMLLNEKLRVCAARYGGGREQDEIKLLRETNLVTAVALISSMVPRALQGSASGTTSALTSASAGVVPYQI
jgi:hypothetical protein